MVNHAGHADAEWSVNVWLNNFKTCFCFDLNNKFWAGINILLVDKTYSGILTDIGHDMSDQVFLFAVFFFIQKMELLMKYMNANTMAIRMGQALVKKIPLKR